MTNSAYCGAEKTAEVCTIWSAQAVAEMGKMLDQCRISDQMLVRITGTNQHIAVKAGFAAEALHADTFNLDAILKDSDLRAFTDRYESSPLKLNHPSNDLVVMQGDTERLGAQMKYFQDANKTQTAFCDTREGVPYYKDADAFIAPADQVPGIKDSARRVELRNQQTRPQIADAARDVQRKATDRLEVDDVHSRSFAMKEAKVIAKGDDNGKGAYRKIQNEYKTASMLKNSMRAAQSAAVITTIIAGSINVVNCLGKVMKGEMSETEAFKYVLKNTAIAAFDSAAKASASTATVCLVARSIPELFQGTVLQNTMVSGSIAGAAMCAVDLIECLILVAAGKMTMAELEARTGKNVLQTGAAVAGASIGAALGAPAGPVGMLIGSLIGGMILSVATTIAIENHIEKQFNDTLNSTIGLVSTQHLMQESLEYLAVAQVTFADFRVSCYISEKQFENQMQRVDSLGSHMRAQLDRL